MRTLFVGLCILTFVTTAVTQEYNYGIGLAFQPYLYKNYNKSDWNNRPGSYPVNPNNFNGRAYGITFQKPLNDVVVLKSDLLYSSQSQEIAISSVVLDDPDSSFTKRLYGIEVKTDFKLLKMPVMIAVTREIGYESGLYISIGAGPQISFLTNYLSSYDHYMYDGVGKVIDYDSVINHITHTPKHFDQVRWDEAQQIVVNTSGETPNIYNKFLFGAVGEIEIQKTIGEDFMIGLGAMFEYDITNSEKYPYWVYPGMGGIANHNRAKSHNVRYGLQFNFMYLFQ